MKLKYIILSIWVAASLAVSCGGGGPEGGLPSRLDSLVEADADSALRLMGQDGERGLVAPRCNVAGAFAGQGDITLQAKTVIIKNSTTVSFGTKLKIVNQ